MTLFSMILIAILSLVFGFILGIVLSPKLINGAIKNIFTDTANNVLKEIADSEKKKANDKLEKDESIISTNMKNVESNIKLALNTLKTSVDNAKTTWTSESTRISGDLKSLTQSHTEWANALSNTSLQGSLGEESLRSILKDIGLIEGAGFKVEKSVDRGENKKYRPDFFVNSANGGTIVIDSKAPMTAFKNAIDCQDPNLKKGFFKKHAEDVLDHAKKLSKKDYPEYVEGSPDFTIMYLNNISIFIHAIEEMPDLIERAAEKNIVICPPILVYATLKAVMLGMIQKDIEANAATIAERAKDVHKRLLKFAEYFEKIGRGLFSAVDGFNRAQTSWNSRLMPKIREFENSSKTDQNRILKDIKQVEALPVGYNQIDDEDDKDL